MMANQIIGYLFIFPRSSIFFINYYAPTTHVHLPFQIKHYRRHPMELDQGISLDDHLQLEEEMKTESHLHVKDLGTNLPIHCYQDFHYYPIPAPIVPTIRLLVSYLSLHFRNSHPYFLNSITSLKRF